MQKQLKKNTPINIAYFIGFMAGDGAYLSGKGRRVDRMSITSTDLDVVNWIDKNVEEFDKSITYLNDNKKLNIYAKLPAYIKTFNVCWTEMFNKYGILGLKENRSVHNISKVNMKYFILGILDADGCISYSKRKDRDRLCVRFVISHPSISLLGKLQNFLIEELSIPSTIAPKGKEKCLVLSIDKVNNVIKLLDWLYSDRENIVLGRKYIKYQDLKKVHSEYYDRGKCYPSDFTRSPEYITLIRSMSGKRVMIIDDVEYMTIDQAMMETGLSKHLIYSRCSQNNKNCRMRYKTNSEIAKSKAKLNKAIKELYTEWLINH